MSKFNPNFWEVAISEKDWEAFTTEDHLYYETPEETEKRYQRDEQAKAIWPKVQEIMEEVLTSRQGEVVSLYFFHGLNQREIAEKVGITQQSVSESLYGKVCAGKTVGGALRKLRKECTKRGIRWP